MPDNKNNQQLSKEEEEQIKAQTAAQMKRGRVNDYVAIALAVSSVFVLWLLQLMGLY